MVSFTVRGFFLPFGNFLPPFLKGMPDAGAGVVDAFPTDLFSFVFAKISIF
jgi:hypothetical protein